ncbi:unnamed protein product [Periconia digitata]|uniref:Uncharacterized protein n=1 Tax=Periconia digitata TaxID=1303443 RepID=A0A9W4XNR7_9PLEO|nr:unnamed protein product [Periconia digitata]
MNGDILLPKCSNLIASDTCKWWLLSALLRGDFLRKFDPVVGFSPLKHWQRWLVWTLEGARGSVVRLFDNMATRISRRNRFHSCIQLNAKEIAQQCHVASVSRVRSLVSWYTDKTCFLLTSTYQEKIKRRSSIS